MTEFEKNHPQQLKDFIASLRKVVDEYHANIYLLDDVFKGVKQIEDAIDEEYSKTDTEVEVEYHKVWDKQTGELLEKYEVIKPKTTKNYDSDRIKSTIKEKTYIKAEVANVVRRAFLGIMNYYQSNNLELGGFDHDKWIEENL